MNVLVTGAGPSMTWLRKPSEAMAEKWAKKGMGSVAKMRTILAIVPMN